MAKRSTKRGIKQLWHYLYYSSIAEEVKKPEDERLTKEVVRRFLAKYTRSVAYKEAMQSAGSTRINLQGEEVEKVTPEHAEIARKSLKE